MSNDVSRIYQFLAQTPNWVEKADEDGNGVLYKSEVWSYLNENLEWDGESSAKSDLINQFWKSIDTNIKGKIVDNNGKSAKNKNALDDNELANVTRRIEAYDIFNNFTAGSIEVPASLLASAGEYRTDVKGDLSVLVEQYISSGKPMSGLEAYLEESLPGIMNKNTAEYASAQYLDSMKELTQQYDYKFGDDKDLQDIINTYVSQLDRDVSAEEIQANVEKLIDAYFAIAGLKESNGVNLADYGYETENSSLNDLQKCVVEARLTEHINQSFDTVFSAVFGDVSFSSDEVKANFMETLDSILSSAKTEFIGSLTNDDFQNLDAKLKEFDLTKYVNDDMKTNVYKEYYSSIADEYTNKLADRFAEGVSSGGIFGQKTRSDERKFGFSLYNKELGSYQLDKNTIRQLMKDLNKELDSFISSFIASGAEPDEFEAKLQDFVENFLMGGDEQEISDAINTVTSETYISDGELDDYKETCISVLDNIVDTYADLKLGSKTLTASNYKELVNAYTDGNDLMDDMEALLKSINTEGKLASYVEGAKDAVDAENAADVKNGSTAAAGVIDEVKSNSLSAIINGKSEIHTEFGIDANGNIVFQEAKTRTVYNTLVNKIKTELNNTEDGKAALEALGGDDVLEKLVQASWIKTYNTFNSSQSNSSVSFVSNVLDNLKTIMNNLAVKPELISVYTAHTSYADTSLTNDLIHYNTKTTYGGDEKISYKGEITQDADGTVHLANKKDDPDYQATMSELLNRLIKKYPSVSADVITNVFREAQKEAIDICKSGTKDCPYGTGNNGSRVEDSKRNWGGSDNRNGDESVIHMDELVQLTLYCFDKLLYQNI